MRRALLFVLLSGLPTAVLAQAPAIPIGSRVRVDRPDELTVSGTLTSQTVDSLIVAAPDMLRTAISTTSIERIRVGDGHSRMRGAVRGMKMGVKIGAAMAASSSIGLIWNRSRERVGQAFIDLLAATASGLLYGAPIGALFAAEKWTTVYPTSPRLSVEPAWNGGPAVTFSLRRW